MSQLSVTVLQLGLLALLWLFVIGVVGVLRRDLYGTRVVPRASSAPPRPAPAARQSPAATPVGPPTAAPVAPGARPAVPDDAHARAAQPPRRLVVTQGPLTGTTIELDRAVVLIGRAPECTLVLTDDYASSRHARLLAHDGQWRLEDLGSTNGTLLALTPRGAPEPLHGAAEVGVGAVIRIGRTTLELQR